MMVWNERDGVFMIIIWAVLGNIKCSFLPF